MSSSNLISVLKETLLQEHDLLTHLSDEQYAAPGQGYYKSSVGMHIRHNLDHFGAFFEGLSSGRIDYESRERNTLIEESTQTAQALINTYIEELQNFSLEANSALYIREEDGAPLKEASWIESSCGRELQFLLGHSVHHHAIIAMMIVQNGFSLPAGFGVAPSTKRYQTKVNN
ncbi:MAG: DinB family protein [Verrucomicrobiota bacterium]